MNVDDRVTTERVVLAAILLVGAVVRFAGIGAESLWFDETVSAHVATTWSVTRILVHLPTRDPHPPLYYAVLKLWTGVAGTSEAGLRSLSAVVDLGSILLVYGVASELYDRRVGLLGALLFALSPFYVWYAREARMYALVTFFALASFYSLIALVENRESRWRNGWTYVGATVAMCYTHALAPLVVLAQTVSLGDGLLDRGYVGGLLAGRWGKLQALVAGAIFPYYLELLVQTFVVGRLMGYVQWIPDPTPGTVWRVLGTYVGRSLPTVRSVAEAWTLGTSMAGLSVLGDLVTILALGIAAAAVVVGVRRDVDTGTEYLDPTRLLVSWFVVPLVGMVVLSELVTPLLVARYTAPAGVAFLILLARGLVLPFEPGPGSPLPGLGPRRGPVLVAVLAGLVLLVPVAGMHTGIQKQQWREATAHVESNATPGDVVLVSPSWADTAYRYYATREDLSVIGVRDASPGRLAAVTEDADVAWVVRLRSGGGISELRSTLRSLGFSLDRRTAFHDVVVHRFDRAG